MNQLEIRWAVPSFRRENTEQTLVEDRIGTEQKKSRIQNDIKNKIENVPTYILNRATFSDSFFLLYEQNGSRDRDEMTNQQKS